MDQGPRTKDPIRAETAQNLHGPKLGSRMLSATLLNLVQEYFGALLNYYYFYS